MSDALRDNPDLDDVFLESMSPGAKRTKRRRKARSQPLSADQARRYAFKVLSILSGLSAPQRTQVLKAADRLNRA